MTLFPVILWNLMRMGQYWAKFVSSPCASQKFCPATPAWSWKCWCSPFLSCFAFQQQKPVTPWYSPQKEFSHSFKRFLAGGLSHIHKRFGLGIIRENDPGKTVSSFCTIPKEVLPGKQVQDSLNSRKLQRNDEILSPEMIQNSCQESGKVFCTVFLKITLLFSLETYGFLLYVETRYLGGSGVWNAFCIEMRRQYGTVSLSVMLGRDNCSGLPIMPPRITCNALKYFLRNRPDKRVDKLIRCQR